MRHRLSTEMEDRYPEILQDQLDFLCHGTRMSIVMEDIKKNIATAMQGDMPHAEAAIVGLISRYSTSLSVHRPIDYEKPKEALQPGGLGLFGAPDPKGAGPKKDKQRRMV